MEQNIVRRNVNVLALVNLQPKLRKTIHELICSILYERDRELASSSCSTVLNKPLSLDRRWAKYDEEFEKAKKVNCLFILCLEKEDYEPLKERHQDNSFAVIFDAERACDEDLFLPSVCSPKFIAKMIVDSLNRKEKDSKRKLLRA